MAQLISSTLHWRGNFRVIWIIIQNSLRYLKFYWIPIWFRSYIIFFQADDCSFLTVTRTSSIEQEATQDCEQLYGTFKISGVGTFAIENNGDCGINEVFQVQDNVGHPTYDESLELTDDSLLSIEVYEACSILIKNLVRKSLYSIEYANNWG